MSQRRTIPEIEEQSLEDTSLEGQMLIAMPAR
jgi:hypothetical protein